MHGHAEHVHTLTPTVGLMHSLSPEIMLSHTCARTHTHTHTHSLTCTHTHTHTLTLTGREKKDRPDRSQLIISKQVGAVVGRLPGQLNGRQFHIQDCEKCQIFVLDHSSAVTVHNCSECDIVLGPCRGR